MKTIPSEKQTEVLKKTFGDSIGKALKSPYLQLRDKQLKTLTSDADTILLLTGRGWGKNFVGTHWLLDRIQRGHEAVAAVAETAGDVRDDIVDPPSGNGVVDVARQKGIKAEYKKSQTSVEFPDSKALLFSGEKPDSLRGFSGSVAWMDELAKYRSPRKAWNQINLTLREATGDQQSQLLITSTPRPIPIIQELIDNQDVQVIRGSSWENEANLDDRFIRQLKKLEGTRLGRQEIHAEILDSSGVLWDYEDIKHITPTSEDEENAYPEFERVVVGLDPSVSDEQRDECGIVVVGKGPDGNAYVLEDLSGQYTTREWGALVIAAYRSDMLFAKKQLMSGKNVARDRAYSEDVKKQVEKDYDHRPADCIHAEVNQGGALVKSQLRTYGTHAAVNGTHTTQSKQVRAEPVHNLYQRGKVYHVGQFPELEDQMTDFSNEMEESPDRVDALAYAIHELYDLSGRNPVDLSGHTIAI